MGSVEDYYLSIEERTRLKESENDQNELVKYNQLLIIARDMSALIFKHASINHPVKYDWVVFNNKKMIAYYMIDSPIPHFGNVCLLSNGRLAITTTYVAADKIFNCELFDINGKKSLSDMNSEINNCPKKYFVENLVEVLCSQEFFEGFGITLDECCHILFMRIMSQ